MYWVSPVFILHSENLSISINNIFRVLFKQIEDSNIEFFMSFDTISIMKDSWWQMTMFDIHILKSILIFFS